MIVAALLDLTQQGYEVSFQTNPANIQFCSITMSHHGLHVRGHLNRDIFTEDQICKSLKYIKERLDLQSKATIL